LPLLKLLCAHASVPRTADIAAADTKLPAGMPQTDVAIHSVIVSNDTDNTMTSTVAAGEHAPNADNLRRVARRRARSWCALRFP
jgi:hypothetical protein